MSTDKDNSILSSCSMKLNSALALQFLLLILPVGLISAQLSPNYYANSCPNVLNIVRSAVKAEIARQRGIGASLLRLHFHDCFVNGCDASVLLDDTPTFKGEKTAFPNLNSLRGFEVIDNIKAQLESSCPRVVSCADILTVASRDSVVALDGPSWQVKLGRRDSTTANFSGANTDLPPPFFNLSGLISAFQTKGFTAGEMVTLSGAHTIGIARCITFRDRIYNDSDISSLYANSLKRNCPGSGGDDNPADLDFTTETEFDNNYYTNLLKKKGLLHSDQQLFSGSGGITDQQVRSYSASQSTFFADFANAMTKMNDLSPLTGTAGQIRTNCRKVN